jgi:hypothetical protein
MGAVEHLKTLCCLGLPPESAMIAVTPLLHEIIPHGGTRGCLLAPDAAITSTYAENPAMGPLFRERLWSFMDDPSAPVSLWIPAFRAVAIGWSLHRQGHGYLESGYYREIEAPLDSCWILGAMIGDAGKSIAFVNLSRPRTASPFAADDVQRLDRLRPWLAHAFRRRPVDSTSQEDEPLIGAAGPIVLSGQVILNADARLLYQTASLEFLLRILAGEPGNYTRHVSIRDSLPAPVLNLVRRITGAANGSSNTPPRMQVSTPYGVLTLEAKWLMPAGALAEEAARDPKSCLIAVTIDLHEHPIAHAARILRENGATPRQTKVGIHLALGKTKQVIADALDVQLSSIESLTKKLYQALDVHNSTELATQIWLGQKRADMLAATSLRSYGT